MVAAARITKIVSFQIPIRGNTKTAKGCEEKHAFSCATPSSTAELKVDSCWLAIPSAGRVISSGSPSSSKSPSACKSTLEAASEAASEAAASRAHWAHSKQDQPWNLEQFRCAFTATCSSPQVTMKTSTWIEPFRLITIPWYSKQIKQISKSALKVDVRVGVQGNVTTYLAAA